MVYTKGQAQNFSILNASVAYFFEGNSRWILHTDYLLLHDYCYSYAYVDILPATNVGEALKQIRTVLVMGSVFLFFLEHFVHPFSWSNFDH